MKSNRRNYYRILHVQPEAPPDVIRASFRSLMMKLRNHPDLGGDHETAVLLNEAYAVLGDPERRRQYDRTLVRSRGPVSSPPRAPAAPKSLPAAAVSDKPPAAAPKARSDEPRTYSSVLHAAYGRNPRNRMPPGSDPQPAMCPFCGFELPQVVHGDTRCRRCESPLALPVAVDRGGGGASARRETPRVSKSDTVLLYEAWQQCPYSARLRDLSPAGISVSTDFALPAHAVFRVVGPSFDVLAEVVSCRRNADAYSLHGRLVSAIFAPRGGVFVSMTA